MITHFASILKASAINWDRGSARQRTGRSSLHQRESSSRLTAKLRLFDSTKVRVQTLFALILFTAHTLAAEIIPQNRRIQWQAGVDGGIPARTTIFRTLTPANSLAEINNAIASCPREQVVYLSAGNYKLSGSIEINRVSGVTLRGAGPGKTILNFSGQSDVGYITFNGFPFADPNVNPPPSIVNWTAGYGQGTTQITLSEASGLAVGAVICLDQLEDHYYVNANGNDGYCTYCGRQSGSRSQMQIVKVTAINGKVVTISPGLYMSNWSAAHSPQAWWVSTGTSRRGNDPVTWCGIEDFSVYNTISPGALFNVDFVNAQNCWAKNINSYNGNTNHFRTYLSSRIEVRHCYCYGTRNAQSQSYGVSWYWASDCLCEDNIFQHVTSPMLNGSATAGCVNAYNFAVDQYYTVNPNWLIEGTGNHAAHSQFCLYEGNYTPNLYIDRIHGTGSNHTVLRNVFKGWEQTPNTGSTGTTLNTYPIAIQAWNLEMNVVGNILGKVGYHKTYESADPASIYYIGYFDASGSTINFDARVGATLLRHGNYDVVNNAQVWDPTITDHNLPQSYLYSSKPAYFGRLSWPPFDPAKPSAASPESIPAGYRHIHGVDPASALPEQRPSPPNNLHAAS
jgi:hypothetical protein